MSAATITLLFLLFAVVMFVFEKIPLGVTSMIVCIGLVVTGVLDIKTAFAGFIDSNVILFVAMFIVGGALFETGMANKIGGIVTHFARSERSLIVAIMVIVGLMSGFLSNTGTAAVLIPVVIGIAAKSGYARSKLLMPLVFAAAMGGNLSLIGAPGNLIAQSALGEIGMSFGFFEYAIVGLPILAAGILFYATLGMKLLPNHPVSDDDSFSGEQDFSNVPKWKQVLSLVILVLTLLGMMSNLATLTIFIPLVTSACIRMGVDPRAAVVGVITASCVSIMTPMAAPCQIMIIEPGGYTLKDYLKCGTPLALILIVVSVFFLPTLYPFA